MGDSGYGGGSSFSPSGCDCMIVGSHRGRTCGGRLLYGRSKPSIVSREVTGVQQETH